MISLQDTEVNYLEETAESIRESIVSMLEEAGSGHTAGPLGMTDIFTALYFKVLKHNPAVKWYLKNGFIITAEELEYFSMLFQVEN